VLGFPHSNEPVESKRVELWVGVTQGGWSPVIWIPMKRDPEGYEAKGRGFDIKIRYKKKSNSMKPKPLFYCNML
jgi:hypothetical protein